MENPLSNPQVTNILLLSIKQEMSELRKMVQKKVAYLLKWP